MKEDEELLSSGLSSKLRLLTSIWFEIDLKFNQAIEEVENFNDVLSSPRPWYRPIDIDNEEYEEVDE